MISTDSSKAKALQTTLNELVFKVIEARDAWIQSGGTMETWENWCRAYHLFEDVQASIPAEMMRMGGPGAPVL